MTTPRIVPLSGSSVLTLHLLLELMNTTGGEVTSRLVSEEDLELNFLCPNVPEDLRVGDCVVLEGDTLAVSWKLHITSNGPLAPDILKRFKKGARP